MKKEGKRNKAEPVVIEDEAIEKLVDELQIVEESIDKTVNTEEHSADTKREELIIASDDGYITQKSGHIRKCSEKTLNKIYRAYEAKRKKDADGFLTDLLISQFSTMLGGLDAIEDPVALTDELRNNDILRKDVESVISVVSPYIPLIGLLGGVAITGKHIYQHKSKHTPPPSENITQPIIYEQDPK